MFCMNGKVSVLRKGIATFLMIILMGSSLAFAGGTAFAAEKEVESNGTGDVKTEEEATEVATAGESQSSGSEVENNTSGGETEDAGLILFAPEEESTAPSTAVSSQPYVAKNQTVKFSYTKKLKYENYYTHNFVAKCNGETLKAYCIEPKVKASSKKSLTAKPYNNKLMKKALYYSIGYPGYSKKTASYLAGVSRKSCYKGNNGTYSLCHIVLSYIYDNKSSKGDAFTGVSGSTKTVVKKFLAAIESWPDPPEVADIGLTASQVKAEWNESVMRQETPEITVTGTPSNTISVPVPTGTTLVKGDTVATSGSVPVTVGESFRLTAPATIQEKYSSPSLTGSIEIFQPYLIKASGRQGQLFGMSVSNAISYSVEWENFGSINLKKISSDESTTADNTYYSLEGAEYELFSKATDTLYGKLITDSGGCATLQNIPYGEYYIKELKASQGYQVDPAQHDITVGAPLQSETVLEKPSKPDLETSAVEGSSGDKSFFVKDEVTGADTTIVDTVKYKNLTPGLEYRIEARLVDKASGCDIPSRVEEIIFTPERPSGNMKIEYQIDSSKLGGRAAVAFEKLYQGENLIAVHEDINNKAQTVNILKPVDSAPNTGDNMHIVLLVIAIGLSIVLGMIPVLKEC